MLTLLVSPDKLAIEMISNLINAKADVYGRLIGNQYGAQALLEDTIGCLKEVEGSFTRCSAISTYLEKVEANRCDPYPAEARQHLEEMLAVCQTVHAQRGLITPAVIVLPELIAALEAKV